MKKLLFSLIGVLLYCVATHAAAVQVSGLYQTVVPVASQSKALQNAAMQQALSQVLIKVSGNSAVVNSTALQSAIANPANYLTSYSYQDGVLADGTSSLLLQVSFDPKAVTTLLQNAQQSVWGQNRPLVLVWLADTQANAAQPILVGTNTENPLTAQFKNDAKARGLPIMFPVMDLTDMQAVTPAAIAAAQLSTIQQASTRYNSDAILAVNLTQNNNQWNGTWTLISQGASSTWQTNGMTMSQAIQAGIDAVSNNLAAKFAVVANAAATNQVQLTVENVQDLSDYAAVTKYLKGLAPVTQAEVTQVTASALIFNLTVTGGEAALQQALSLDHHLQPVMAVPSTTDSGTGLVYQWIV